MDVYFCVKLDCIFGKVYLCVNMLMVDLLEVEKDLLIELRMVFLGRNLDKYISS